jgi:DNA-binding LytR/AlgR family response regulator
MIGENTMIRIMICDDDPGLAAALSEKLTALASQYDDELDFKIGPIFTDGNLVLSFMDTMSFDIIFLDIDMPKMSGFELAQEITKRNPKALIIFVSAYDNFVYQSFAYSPFRFLRKLHLAEELPPAFEKAVEKCISDTQGLSFNSSEGNVTLRPSDIMYFENDRNYYCIRCENGVSYKCRGTIKSLDSIYSDKRFVKIHSGYIVNLEHVAEVIGGSEVRMKNGAVLGISQSHKTSFKEAYMQFVRRRYSR